MAHSYTVLEADTLCVRYSGLVTYAERKEVLPSAARRMRDHAYRNLIVDFSAAELVEEDEGARRDYIAAAIAAPWPDTVRIASVGLPPRHNKPIELASVVRQFQLANFDSIALALRWLTTDTALKNSATRTVRAAEIRSTKSSGPARSL